MTQPFLTAQGITKQFAGVQALKDVSITIGHGEIRSLVGENGSGKSTLIKILAGVYQPDKGTIAINGREFRILRPMDAISQGIQVIYQDFSLFPNLSIAENIAMNTELKERRLWVRWRRIRRIADQVLAQIGLNIDVNQRVESLLIAQKQLIAIARALVHDTKLIIMDEPTTALTRREIDTLFAVIKKLQQASISVLFVSHKLNEVFEISDRITILRNGQSVAQGATAQYQRGQLMELMTGRILSPQIPGPRFTTVKPPLLKVSHLTRRGAFTDVSFFVQGGQIMGITGLLGSGRSELALALCGLKPAHSGTITLGEQNVSIRNIRDAIRHGLAYVPEDRLTEGLFLERSVESNLLATTVGQLLNKLRLLDRHKVRTISRRCIDQWDIKPPRADVLVKNLSGGNQQKVVLAKWLATEAKILILNGPTVGVDIKAKMDIHAQIRRLAAQGLAILVMSDDIPELVQVCHCILLMHRGRIIAQLEESDRSEELVQNKLNQLT